MENELHAIRNEETKNERRRKKENHRWEGEGEEEALRVKFRKSGTAEWKKQLVREKDGV